mmetsp:Transcript_40894/g.73472  ORF Transcript_40894/g.73472 Transcript_40894/m.73472 type:complete len:112 (-) Transcript_40894:131-466(-)
MTKGRTKAGSRARSKTLKSSGGGRKKKGAVTKKKKKNASASYATAVEAAGTGMELDDENKPKVAIRVSKRVRVAGKSKKGASTGKKKGASKLKGKKAQAAPAGGVETMQVE